MPVSAFTVISYFRRQQVKTAQGEIQRHDVRVCIGHKKKNTLSILLHHIFTNRGMTAPVCTMELWNSTKKPARARGKGILLGCGFEVWSLGFGV